MCCIQKIAAKIKNHRIFNSKTTKAGEKLVKQYSLTFDFGSGSVKTALISDDHQILASCNKPYSTYYPKKGWAVQNPETSWICMQETTQQVMEYSGILPCQIKGIAISHTGSTILFVDKNGRPLSECVMWMDGRAVEQARALNREIGQELYTGKNVIAKLRWFMEEQPDLIRTAYKLVDLQGYLFYQMTGKFAYEITGACTTRLFDPKSCCWDESKFELSGFPRRLVPKRVVRSEELVGRLTAEASRLLGVAEGTPVFGGCCDHATAVLGAGCIHPGDAHIYIGTSAWLAVTAESYTDVPAIRRSPVPGQWYHYFESDSGGISIDYLVRQYYQKEISEGIDVYSLLGEESSDISSYKDILFLPFLTGASAPISDVRVRASLLNIEANTTRGQIARAVLEGLGFNLLWLKEFYQAKHGWNIRCLRGIGGGMILPESVQTIADILGDPITTMRDPRFAGNIGLAVCVETGLSGQPDGYSVLETTGIFDRTFEPRPQQRERYERLFPIYKSAFYALSNIYNILNKRKDD